jgi:hypothetical protein
MQGRSDSFIITMKIRDGVGLLIFALLSSAVVAADTFRVATYQVENYLDQPTKSRPHIKSPEAKAKIRESVRALNPDVLAL